MIFLSQQLAVRLDHVSLSFEFDYLYKCHKGIYLYYDGFIYWSTKSLQTQQTQHCSALYFLGCILFSRKVTNHTIHLFHSTNENGNTLQPLLACFDTLICIICSGYYGTTKLTQSCPTLHTKSVVYGQEPYLSPQ
jgi:hypothetical protein